MRVIPSVQSPKRFSALPRRQCRGILLSLLSVMGAGAILLSGVTCRAAEEISPAPTGTAAQAEDIQQGLSSMVQKTANRIDGFFGGDGQSTWDENRTSVRIRIDFDFIEGQSISPGAQIKLNLILPSLNDKVRLVMNPDDDDNTGSSGNSLGDDSELALRYVGRELGKLNSSYDLGLRIKDSELAVFLRWNAKLEFDLGRSWNNRYSNQLYWYTDTGFRNDFRVYFEKALSRKFLFRSRTRVQYYEEYGTELYPEQRFTLYQSINLKHALAYEVLAEVVPYDETAFDEDNIYELDEQYTHYQARLRYRTNWMFPWLFFEVWPIVAWPEEHDYETTYAVRVRMELHFGYREPYRMRLDE
jgi:hypothetical protein